MDKHILGGADYLIDILEQRGLWGPVVQAEQV
jgi:hypothetical protein